MGGPCRDRALDAGLLCKPHANVDVATSVAWKLSPGLVVFLGDEEPGTVSAGGVALNTGRQMMLVREASQRRGYVTGG